MLVLICSHLSGCYGSFPLTNAVYKINGNVTDNTIIHSIVMIILVIIPVYGISMIVDGIVLNSIEFWSGDKMDFSKTYIDNNGNEVALIKGETENEAILQIRSEGKLIMERTYLRNEDGTTSILDMERQLVGTVEPQPNGEFVITEVGAEAPTVLTAQQINELKTSALAKGKLVPMI